MEPLHDRMPVILSEDSFPIWLDSQFQNKQALEDLLCPCNSDLLEAYPVSKTVNSPRNEMAECVERVKADQNGG